MSMCNGVFLAEAVSSTGVSHMRVLAPLVSTSQLLTAAGKQQMSPASDTPYWAACRTDPAWRLPSRKFSLFPSSSWTQYLLGQLPALLCYNVVALQFACYHAAHRCVFRPTQSGANVGPLCFVQVLVLCHNFWQLQIISVSDKRGRVWPLRQSGDPRGAHSVKACKYMS